MTWYSKRKKDTLKRKCLNLRNMSLTVEFEAISVSNGDRDSFKAKRKTNNVAAEFSAAA